MGFLHVFARIPVSDRAAAIDWYERLLGAAPGLVPNDREAAWCLTDGGWLYVEVELRAAPVLHTVLVDDLDAFLAHARTGGISAGPVEAIAAGVRQAIFTDPDGNRLKVAQAPS